MWTGGLVPDQEITNLSVVFEAGRVGGGFCLPVNCFNRKHLKILEQIALHWPFNGNFKTGIKSLLWFFLLFFSN